MVRSVSTNSYNIAHNENCNFYRSSSLNQSSTKSAMKKSNTCHEETIKSNQPTESRLMNSNTIESLSPSLQDRDCVAAKGGLTKSGISNSNLNSNLNSNSNSSQTLDKSDKNGKLSSAGLYSLQEEQAGCVAVEHRKYDIGQLSNLSSPSAEENEDLELFNKINQLQKELDSKTKANFEILNGAAGSSKKQRPKSELIAGLAWHLDEYIDDTWGDMILKYSPEQLKSYYSLSFPSPRYLPQNLSNKNLINEQKTGQEGHPFGNKSSVKIRDRTLASNGKPRPKTIHSSYSGADDFNEILKTPISYFDSDLNEINELESFNDEPFIREETMTVMNGKESPMKSDEESTANTVKISNLSDNLNGNLNENLNANLNGKSLRARSSINQQTKISPTANGSVTSSNANTICSPMSTSSMMCSSSISKSLSQSSGYQSFMEDAVFEQNAPNNESNSHTLVNLHQMPVSSINSGSIHTSVNHAHLNGDKHGPINGQVNGQITCQIKLRNQPNQLRLGNQANKRYSCNIPGFGNYDDTQRHAANDQSSPGQVKADEQSKVQSASTNYGQPAGKQLPNSSSSVEISLNGKVEHWERKMMKTYSTNAFTGKDAIYSNGKNMQRTTGGSNSFLNLSDLIRKRKDKKKKKEYQFCMLVFGGNEKSNGNQSVQFSKQPIAVWKLYI